MEREVPRAVKHTRTSEIVAMALFLFSMPRWLIDDADAFLVLPGQGEDDRLAEAVEAYESSPSGRHLLVAGSYPGERLWQPVTVESLRQPPYNLMGDGSRVHIQPEADNTLVQMDWVMQMICDLHIERLVLVVSNYHCFRAYLTLLAAFKRHCLEPIAMVPLPVWGAPGQASPETGLSFLEMCAGEVARIFEYQPRGDVAAAEQLWDYLNWMNKQFINP